MKKLLIELRHDVEQKLSTNYMCDTNHKRSYIDELNKMLKKLNDSIDLCNEYKGRLR